MNCAFCELDPSNPRVIRQSETLTSFLADPRLTPGHTLVVPRRHIERPIDLAPWEAKSIHYEIGLLADQMIGTIALGVDTWQKFRPYVPEGTGTKMDHMHFHVIPSRPGAEIYDTALRWSGDAHQPLDETERDFMVDFLRRQF